MDFVGGESLLARSIFILSTQPRKERVENFHIKPSLNCPSEDEGGDHDNEE